MGSGIKRGLRTKCGLPTAVRVLTGGRNYYLMHAINSFVFALAGVRPISRLTAQAQNTVPQHLLFQHPNVLYSNALSKLTLLQVKY